MIKRAIVVISAVIILLSGVGIYKRNNMTTDSLVSHNVKRGPTAISIPTGTGKISDPTSWLTYSFAHDFTIAYPPSWIVIPGKDGSGVDFQTAFFHQDDDFTMPYGDSTQVSYSSFGQTDLSDMSLQNGGQFPDDATGETDVIRNVAHVQIDGFPAIEFDYYPTDNTHFVKTRIAIQKGQRLYRFDSTYAEESGKTLFEEMVKSIHFSS